MRGHHVPGTTFSLGSLTLPSVIGMSFALGGLLGVVGLIAVDREDGTLLRAKATPDGMAAYVIGRITHIAATTLVGLVLTLLLGLLAFPGVRLTVPGASDAGRGGGARPARDDPDRHHARLAATEPAVHPAGAAAVRRAHRDLRDLLPDHPPARAGCRASGSCSPCTGSGSGCERHCCRSHLAAVEIDGSWRLPLVFLALALWAVLGLTAAPPVLRRMARRESGSRVAQRRERAMLRAT